MVLDEVSIFGSRIIVILRFLGQLRESNEAAYLIRDDAIASRIWPVYEFDWILFNSFPFR